MRRAVSMKFNYLDDGPSNTFEHATELGYAPSYLACVEIYKELGARGAEDPVLLKEALIRYKIPLRDRKRIEARYQSLVAKGWSESDVRTINRVSRALKISDTQAEALYSEILSRELPPGNWSDTAIEWMRAAAIINRASLAEVAAALPDRIVNGK